MERFDVEPIPSVLQRMNGLRNGKSGDKRPFSVLETLFAERVKLSEAH